MAANCEYESEPLRVFFLPYLIAGHMIPMVDVARLFAAHTGVDVTIVTTAANALVFRGAVGRDSTDHGRMIRIHTLPLFSSSEEAAAGGRVENLSAAASAEESKAVSQAIQLLREPVEKLLRHERPDCIVSDMFYPWTGDVAADLGVPRLLFHGSGYFHFCADRSSIEDCSGGDGDDNNAVLLSGLPDRITMLRSQLPDWTGLGAEFLEALRDSERKTYGAVMNSFAEMEPTYVAHFRRTVGTKEWSVGPVSSWVNKDAFNKSNRGRIINIEKSLNEEILTWLNSKQHKSVVYVCFGSLTRFPAAQLLEIAHGLESCGHPFIWVARKQESDEYGEIFPARFEQRMKESERGFVVRNWAPQMLILDHPAVGGMVTHCGWNSVLECVAAGLPMVTWPLFAEQFYNEKLLTEVLRVGVSVGVREWSFDWWHLDKEVVGRERVENAVRILMGSGEEASEMRRRARKLAEEAKKAVNSGGSSQTNLMALINELKSLKSKSSDVA